jgi:hypothetical protein
VPGTLAPVAEGCVFADDQRRNIAGAAACNMVAVLFDVKNPIPHPYIGGCNKMAEGISAGLSAAS